MGIFFVYIEVKHLKSLYPGLSSHLDPKATLVKKKAKLSFQNLVSKLKSNVKRS